MACDKAYNWILHGGSMSTGIAPFSGLKLAELPTAILTEPSQVAIGFENHVTIRAFLNLIGHHQSLVVFTRKPVPSSPPFDTASDQREGGGAGYETTITTRHQRCWCLGRISASWNLITLSDNTAAAYTIELEVLTSEESRSRATAIKVSKSRHNSSTKLRMKLLHIQKRCSDNIQWT